MNLRKLFIAVLISLASNVSLGFSQENGGSDYPVYVAAGEELGLIEHSTLTIDDEVSDNCWTNSGATRSKVYLIYEQNDLFVPDYNPAFFNYRTVNTTLSALGFRASNGLCVVSAIFDVQSRITSTLGGANGKQRFAFMYDGNLFERSAIFVNPANANNQISDFFEGAASEFVARTLAAKRSKDVTHFLTTYPSADEKPMSTQEWEKMLSEMTSSKTE